MKCAVLLLNWLSKWSFQENDCETMFKKAMRKMGFNTVP